MLLAQGKRLVLVLLYLGAFYARLDECSNNVVQLVGQYDMVTSVDANYSYWRLVCSTLSNARQIQSSETLEDRRCQGGIE